MTSNENNKSQYYDDQVVFDLDVDDLYNKLVVPIDNLRSGYNIFNPGENNGLSPFQESRCHAFYRMLGLPIVAPDGTKYYSSGYDPNLNTDSKSQSKQTDVYNSFINSQTFLTSQLNPRELNVEKKYKKIFFSQDVNSQAILLGSVFIRSFDKQFTDGLDPFTLDKAQEQNIDDRKKYISNFYGNSNNQLSNINFDLLVSKHYLKPFIVDPRIESTVRPAIRKICAPFLLDKSQTVISQGSDGNKISLQRPFIEKVISTRFNSKNVSLTNTGEYVQNTINIIKSSDSSIDQSILTSLQDPLSKLYANELIIFRQYFSIIRSVLETLHESIREIEYVRDNINWQPVPNQNGIEKGAEINDLDQSDPNNKQLEIDIILTMQKQAVYEASFDVGVSSPDLGGFAFSNIDDMIFSAFKSTSKYYDTQIEKLKNKRNKIGNNGIECLKNIEMIMGEFSGLGIIDILLIQAALWIMPANSLLGLIDLNAWNRLKKTSINLSNFSQNTITDSLTDFEKTLIVLYKLSQKYFDDISKGDASLTTQS